MVWLFPFVCYTRSDIPKNLVEYGSDTIKSKFYGIVKGSSLVTSNPLCDDLVKRCGPNSINRLLKLCESCLKDKEISPSNKLNVVQLVQVIAKSYNHNARAVARSGVLKVLYNVALLRNTENVYYFKKGVDLDSVRTLAEYAINTIEDLASISFYGALVTENVSPEVADLVSRSKRIKEKLLKAGASFTMNAWELPYHRNPSLKTLPGSNDLVHMKSIETKFKEIQYNLSVVENEMANINFFDESVEFDEVKCTEFISVLSLYEHHNQVLVQECVDSEDLSNYDALMEINEYIRYLLTVAKNRISGEPLPTRTFSLQTQGTLFHSRNTDLQCSAAVEEFTDDNNLSMEELGLSSREDADTEEPKDDDTMEYISRHTTLEPIKISPGYFANIVAATRRDVLASGQTVENGQDDESVPNIENGQHVENGKDAENGQTVESPQNVESVQNEWVASFQSATENDAEDNWASFSGDEDEVPTGPGPQDGSITQKDESSHAEQHIQIEDINAIVSSLSSDQGFPVPLQVFDLSPDNKPPDQPSDDDSLCENVSSLKETLYHITNYLDSKADTGSLSRETVMDDEEAFSRTVVNVHMAKFEKPLSTRDAHLENGMGWKGRERQECMQNYDDVMTLGSMDSGDLNAPSTSEDYKVPKPLHEPQTGDSSGNGAERTTNAYLYGDVLLDGSKAEEVHSTEHKGSDNGVEMGDVPLHESEPPELSKPTPLDGHLEPVPPHEQSSKPLTFHEPRMAPLREQPSKPVPLEEQPPAPPREKKSRHRRKKKQNPFDYVDTTNVCNSASSLLNSISIHLDESEPRSHQRARHPVSRQAPMDGYSHSSYARYKESEWRSTRPRRDDHVLFAKDFSFDHTDGFIDKDVHFAAMSDPQYAFTTSTATLDHGHKSRAHADSRARVRTKPQEYDNGNIIRGCILYKKNVIYEDVNVVVSFVSVSRYEPNNHLECTLSILNRGTRMIKHLQYNFMNFENFPLELLFLNNPKKVIEPGRVADTRFKVDCYGAYVGIPKVTILVIQDGVIDGKTINLYLPLPIISFFTPDTDYRHLNSTEYYESANFKNIMQNKVYFKIKANIEYSEIIKIATLGGKFKILDSTRNEYGSVYLVSTFINRHPNSSFVEKFTVFCMIERSMDRSFNLHVSSDSYRLSNSVATLYKYLFQH